MKNSVILCGFFARGNAGDEAFLHAQYGEFSKSYNIILPIEHHGAVPGFQKWHPYDKCEVINFDEVPRVYGKDVIGLHVGGGSLPFGFCGQFVLSALDARKIVMYSGIDALVRDDEPVGGIRDYLYKKAEFLSVRSRKSFESLSDHGLRVHHGADWAIHLPAPADVMRARRAVIVCRGFGKIDREHRIDVLNLIEWLEARGYTCVFLPFAPEDEDFLAQVGAPVERRKVSCWWDPPAIIKEISTAEVVISLGRLHALVFALRTHTPALAIDPGIISAGKRIPNRKNMFFCREFDLPFYDGIPAFLAASSIEFPPPAKGFPTEYYQRLSDQVNKIRTLLSEVEFMERPQEAIHAKDGISRGESANAGHVRQRKRELRRQAKREAVREERKQAKLANRSADRSKAP